MQKDHLRLIQFQHRMREAQGYRELARLATKDLRDVQMAVRFNFRAQCLLGKIANDESLVEFLYLHKVLT